MTTTLRSDSTTTAPALTPRQKKAIQIIEAGLVAFVPGESHVIVTGSKGEQYRCNRTECTCPDFKRRGGPCKHQLASDAIVTVYRAARAEAKRTGRCRLPASVAKALTNGTLLKQERSRALAAILDGDQDDLFPAQTLDRPRTALVIDGEPVASGLDRPTAANPDGYCVKCGSPEHARCAARVRKAA